MLNVHMFILCSFGIMQENIGKLQSTFSTINFQSITKNKPSLELLNYITSTFRQQPNYLYDTTDLLKTTVRPLKPNLENI